MMKVIYKITLVASLAVLIAGGVSFVYAQSSDPVSQREAELQAELDAVEREMAQWQDILRSTEQQSSSIQRDIDILNAKIEEARLSIRAKNIAIEQLRGEIGIRSETLVELEEKIGRGRESLAQLIRQKNDIDSYTLVEVMLSNEDMSDFFADLDTYDSIKTALHASFNEIRDTKDLTQQERESLRTKVVQETDIKASIEAEKAVVERNEIEKQRLLDINRAQEKTYEQVLKEREQRAAQIRSALFALRDTSDISFGQALEYANRVYQATGVRPAFLLSIITQESNLGQNVGTCNRPGDSRTWQDIMPGPHDNSWRDDQTTFLRLMAELGRSPEGTPLSCPMGHGWGGAMGPSQFIPTTWSSYQSRIASVVGVPVPDPWNPLHAFMASGIYLADLGAAGGGYSAEREAALRYYAGGNWNDPRNAFYGDQVMNRVNSLQADINILQGI